MSTNRIEGWCLALFAAALGAACADTTDGSFIALEDLPARYAERYCEQRAHCESIGTFSDGVSDEDCKPYSAAVIEDRMATTAVAIERGSIIYHGDQAAKCLASLGLCDFQAQDPACDAMLEGTIAKGGNCEQDEECAKGSYCRVEQSCPGTCTARIADGKPCDNYRACERRSYCNQTCMAHGQQGSPCGDANDPSCGMGLLCVSKSGADGLGSCRPLEEAFAGEEGDPCNYLDNRHCKKGLSCTGDTSSSDQPDGVCTPLLASGASCEQGEPDPCPAGEACIEGTCTPLAKKGEACMYRSMYRSDCGPALYCSEQGKCRSLATQRLGDACSEDNDCTSYYCDNAQCAVRPACQP